MVAKKTTVYFSVLVCLSLVQTMAFGANPEAPEMEKLEWKEYKQELSRIEAMRKSFAPEPTNDLKSFEKFADEIQSKWSRKNKEYYARLMGRVAGLITSGYFKGDRRYELAREYALSALEKPGEIGLQTELELTGHVMTDMYTPYAPKGADFAERRKKDVQIRLHAWKRLTDAIDRNWDPSEILWGGNAPLPAGVMGEAGMSPENIEDSVLRAEYEATIQRNRQRSERHTEQSRLHEWLKRFPRHAEPYIIRAYSKPPFNLAELKQYLQEYVADQETRTRILDTVRTKMTDELLAAYNRTVHELVRQLEEDKNLSNYAKCQICYVLGTMRAQRAVSVLVENIDLKAEKVAPKDQLPRWFSHPAREALVQIGQAASCAIMDIIGSDKFDPTKVHAYAEVVAEIERPEYALMKLKERHTKTKEDKMRKQYEMVIARVQEIAAREM